MTSFCADVLIPFFIFSSCRVSMFLSREVLLECHIAVVSFDIMKCSSRSRLFYLRYRASYFNKFFMFWHVVVVAAVIFLLFLLRLLFLVLLPQCSWIVTDTCLAVQILIVFLSYLQDILSFSCSPSTNLNGSSVDFFVIGSSLVCLESKWPYLVGSKFYWTFSKTWIFLWLGRKMSILRS